MYHSLVIVIAAIIFSSFQEVHGDTFVYITERVIACIGNDTVLPCAYVTNTTTPDVTTITWTWLEDHPPNEKSFLVLKKRPNTPQEDGPGFEGRVSLVKRTNQASLRIKNTRLIDSRRYRCGVSVLDPNGGDKSEDMQLTVKVCPTARTESEVWPSTGSESPSSEPPNLDWNSITVTRDSGSSFAVVMWPHISASFSGIRVTSCQEYEPRDCTVHNVPKVDIKRRITVLYPLEFSQEYKIYFILFDGKEETFRSPGISTKAPKLEICPMLAAGMVTGLFMALLVAFAVIYYQRGLLSAKKGLNGELSTHLEKPNLKLK